MLRLVECGRRRYLSFEELEPLPFLFHLFTVKQPEPAFPAVACDAPNADLLACLGRTETVVALRQTHSNRIHWVSGSSRGNLPRGDGLLTSLPGFLLAVQTADCLPVLLVDRRRRIVGNLHAGWRGTLADITGTALRRLLETGSDPADLLVAFGPGIAPGCYPVGPEVVAAFQTRFAEADSFLAAGRGTHAGSNAGSPPGAPCQGSRFEVQRSTSGVGRFLDLQQANRLQALRAGLQPCQILGNAYCTRCDSDLFFSYRREGARTGRMFALAGISGTDP